MVRRRGRGRCRRRPRGFIRAMIEDEEQQRRNWEYFRALKIKRQMLRDISNIFESPVQSFRRLYRVTPQMALDLVDLLRDELLRDPVTRISEECQVLIFLRFMAEGPLQKGLAQDFNHPVSQALVSRILNKVATSVCAVRKRFIYLPRTRHERIQIRTEFQKYMRLPTILGLVDGVLVRLRRPGITDEASYCNYKEGSCVNVQIIVDAKGIIRGVRVIPGSYNDQYNWEFSNARRFLLYLRNNYNIVMDEGIYHFLADLGYASSPIMLTPIHGAAPGTPEAIYTQEHCTARSLVERTIGAMTGVWYAVNRSRKLFYKPRTVGKFITAAAVLHNFRKMNGYVLN